MNHTAKNAKPSIVSQAASMQPQEFLYWLHGFLYISGVTKLNQAQTDNIQQQLNRVSQNNTSSTNAGAAAFCQFLKGYFELTEPVSIDEDTTAEIGLKLGAAMDSVMLSQNKTKPVPHSNSNSSGFGSGFRPQGPDEVVYRC